MATKEQINQHKRFVASTYARRSDIKIQKEKRLKNKDIDIDELIKKTIK
tara:strand:- start:945 stop:1091 length:147 start_codon:yes stop_codon:yes gene_type:complete